MTAKNDITGDSIQSRPGSDEYRNNFDKVFATMTKDETIAMLRAEVARLKEVINDIRNNYR